MKTIQEAADSLLKKGEITQADYEEIKSAGLMEKDAGILQKLLVAIPKYTGELSQVTKGLVKGVGQPLRDLMFTAGTAGIGGYAVKELAVDPFILRSKTESSFDSLKQKVPQLKQYSNDQLRENFDIIKTFSPTAATNPLVAGHLVNKMLSFEGVDHKLIQDLVNIEKGIASPTASSTMIESVAKSMATTPNVAFGKGTDSTPNADIG